MAKTNEFRKDELEKFLNFIEDVSSRSGNEWFGRSLIQRLGSQFPIQSSTISSENSQIKDIHEYCVANVLEQQAVNMYKWVEDVNLREILIVNKLERAGIKVPNGQITRDVLLNPKTADALRPTTPGFRRAPKATVEFGTLLTPAGQRAAQIYEAAKNTGDELTQQEYRNILLSAMRDSSRGKPTPWESLARVASDEALSVTRIAAPTQDDPFSISGTFMGAAGPNIRIPLIS